MTRAPAPAAAKGGKKSPKPDILDLQWTLAELPSAQHRAGLAGLVLMTRWLERQPAWRERGDGRCEVHDLSSDGARLRIDPPGMHALFDEVYGATSEEVESAQLRKDRHGNEVTPIRVDERTEIDGKNSKSKTRRVFVYPQVVPRGAFIADHDPAADTGKGWAKLWRDMVWQIFRGVPATRAPFDSRAAGEPTTDAADAFDALIKPQAGVKLPSTYYLGAQEYTAEGVPFRDIARLQFLLHFSTFAAQVYVPTVIDRDGKSENQGYVIVFPDVGDLAQFCDDLPSMLLSRGTKIRGFRPEEAFIDLAVEGAFDLSRRLRDSLERRTGRQQIRSSVVACEAFHVEKEGNNIRLWSRLRVEPDRKREGDLAALRTTLWHPDFRRLRLSNAVDGRPWTSGFDALLARLPHREVTGREGKGSRAYFQHDAKETFLPYSERSMSQDEPNSIERLVYRAVGVYLSRKLNIKYDLAWADAKASEQGKAEFGEKREKVAREAFLAVRARTGVDFVDWFAATLCSVPQHMSENDFLLLSRQLATETDHVRTLTLLALSARG